jgi:hypothetical protein
MANYKADQKRRNREHWMKGSLQYYGTQRAAETVNEKRITSELKHDDKIIK